MYPILFKIGNAAAPSYSFMLSLAFICGAFITIGVCKKQEISPYKILGLVAAIQVFSFLGSRFLFAVNNYSLFAANPLNLFTLSPGGLAFTGGFILSIIAALIYMKITHLPAWEISDCVVPALAVGIFLTKIGCFLGGCCFGKETSFFLGVRFPSHSLAAQKFGAQHLVHPTQLYEAFSGLIILAVLILINRKHKGFEGQLFLSFMILYLGFRTFNEGLRGDVAFNYVFHLSQTQFLNILLIAFAALVYWKRSANFK
jgi:phosphatidylglycerol:prolipoprotein diacylglycerol transferase